MYDGLMEAAHSLGVNESLSMTANGSRKMCILGGGEEIAEERSGKTERMWRRSVAAESDERENAH